MNQNANEQGHARAQYNLGLRYFTGEGIARDDREAIRWFRLAAEQGYAEAQHILGAAYSEGRGVPQDDREAVRWYRLAAEQANADAQYNLGVSYATGRGVPQDDREAVRWYRLAAEQGHDHAQVAFGKMYATGRGVPQDDVGAVRWFRLAAEQGHAKAQHILGAAYATGRGVSQDNREAARWYRLAAEQGYPKALETLGAGYTDEGGVRPGAVPAAERGGRWTSGKLARAVLFGLLGAFVGRAAVLGVLDYMRSFESDLDLSEVASAIAPSLPMMVDSETEITAVFGIGDRLTYSMTLVNVGPEDVSGAEVEQFIQQDIKPAGVRGVCSGSEIREALRRGATLTYIFHFSDGTRAGGYDITPGDCGF